MTLTPLAEWPADDAAGRLVRWGQAAAAAHALAKSLTGTQFVPEVFQGETKVGDATAAILLGAEVGLSPVASLRALYVAKNGQPAMYTRTMLALVLSRGHEVWTEHEDETRVVVAGRRAGSQHIERATWTLDRARAAGLARNPVYRDHPQAMLYARAAGDVARRIAPDVLLGIPEQTAEEIDAEIVTAEAGPSGPVPTGRPLQRRLAPAPPAVVDVPLPEPAAAPVRPQEPAQAPVEEVEAMWAAPAAGDPEEAAQEQAPEEEPAPGGSDAISPAQRRMLHAEFNAAGLDRTTYVAWARRHTGREGLTTTNDLTKAEASHLLDTIQRIKSARARGEQAWGGEDA